MEGKKNGPCVEETKHGSARSYSRCARPGGEERLHGFPCTHGAYVPGAGEGEGEECRCAVRGLAEGVLQFRCVTGNAVRHSWLVCGCVCACGRVGVWACGRGWGGSGSGGGGGRREGEGEGGRGGKLVANWFTMGAAPEQPAHHRSDEDGVQLPPIDDGPAAGEVMQAIWHQGDPMRHAPQ